MSITAIIPVKGSSSRLPGKNILPFGSGNLLTHKISQLKQVPLIDDILVSSDSEEMLRIASSENVRTIKRPDDLANESRPFGDLIVYITGLLRTETLMWTPVTSPTLDEEFYKKAISKYYEVIENNYDSFTTVTPFKHFLFDKGKPFNFDPDNAITNSQDLPKWDLWTCGCSIISVKLAYEKKFIFGSVPYCFEVSAYQALDIDTKFDYEVAKAMWEIYHDKK